MSCPHGCPRRPEEEYGSGECYTCLERRDDCGCDYCIKGLQKALDTGDLRSPAWFQTFLKKKLIPTITKANYKWALSLSRLKCKCTNRESEGHDESECIAAECKACGLVRCMYEEPLHFHHDGCTACDTRE